VRPDQPPAIPQSAAERTLAARLSLLEVDRAAAAAAARDLAAGLSPLLHDDVAFLLPETNVLYGAPATRDRLRGAEGAKRLWWTPLHVELSADSTLGWTYGVTVADERGDSAPRHGKYLAAWRRTAEGWRLAAFVATAGLPRGSASSGDAPVLPALPEEGAAADFARADRAFSALASRVGAARAFGAFAAPDAVTFPGSGDLARGPADIAARLADFSRVSSWAWTPIVAVGAGSGDLGYTVGEATILVRAGEKTDTLRSKYLTIWRRLPDGRIAFAADAGNSRPTR